MPAPDEPMTAAETRFLKQFIANYTAGRRVMCMIVHLLVTIGAVAMFFVAFSDHILNLWRPHP